MTPRSKLIVTLCLLVVLGGLGVADYYFSGENFFARISGGSNSSDSANSAPAGAVMKNEGPQIADVLAHRNLTSQTTSDESLLAQVVTDGTSIQSMAILADGDRAGSVTWVESGEVKTYFVALKEALLNGFSAQVTDLKDETLQGEGKPVRNILTFLDPALSTERIVFVRVRQRLYEFHLTAGKEEAMNGLIEELTGN